MPTIRCLQKNHGKALFIHGGKESQQSSISAIRHPPSAIGLLLIGLFAFTSTASNQEETGETLQVGDIAPDFTLQDAADKAHSLKKMRGKLVLLIMGNRKIRKEDDKWAEAFQRDYRENKEVLGYIVADMRSVPGFVPKGFIKRQLKKNKPPVTLLLDWEGEVHQAYHTEKEKPNLYLISPTGKIAFHVKANFDPEIYQKLKAEIQTTSQINDQ